MKILLIGMIVCVLLGCGLEAVEDSEADFTVPETPYIGPLSGVWDLWPMGGLAINGVIKTHDPSTFRLYPTWEFTLSIVGMVGQDDCIAFGQWYFDPPGVFHFNVQSSTNYQIMNKGVFEANYIYSNSPQSLYVDYTTDSGNIITIDCVK